MFSTREWHQIFVGGAATKTTSTIAAMNTGEIGVFTPGGTMYTEASADADDPFIVVFKTTDSAYLTSEKLTKADVVSVHLKVGAAAAEQIDYIGYNGSANSIDAQNSTMYRIRLNFLEGFQNNDHGTTFVKTASYQSDSSGAQHEIARGLAKNGNDNMSKEPKNTSGNPIVRFKAICNEATNTTNDSSGIMTVVKGSKFVNISESSGGAGYAGNFNGTTSDMAVNDFLRISDTDAAAALTDDVFRIVAITGTVGGAGPVTLELDRPFSGTSGTRTDATDSTQVILSATGIANNWGVGI